MATDYFQTEKDTIKTLLAAEYPDAKIWTSERRAGVATQKDYENGIFVLEAVESDFDEIDNSLTLSLAVWYAIRESDPEKAQTDLTAMYFSSAEVISKHYRKSEPGKELGIGRCMFGRYVKGEFSAEFLVSDFFALFTIKLNAAIGLLGEFV